jgi:hypothetical protein
MVAKHLTMSDEVYTYITYCGKCRHQWGSMGVAHDWLFCPYCTARIGNYVFADGVEHWHARDFNDEMPEVWRDDAKAKSSPADSEGASE